MSKRKKARPAPSPPPGQSPAAAGVTEAAVSERAARGPAPASPPPALERGVDGPRAEAAIPGAATDGVARRRDRRVELALFAAGVALLLFTEREVGFVRDESVYFAAAENHARWFQLLVREPLRALGDEAITQAFDFNHEHPAVMKNLFGLSYLLFHEGLGLLRPAAAFRVPAFLAAGLVLVLIYRLARRRVGPAAAAFAAASFFLVPRQFFNAHLSCFDVPMATAWAAVVWCFVEALERRRFWLWTGVAFGLALGTKHNAFFIPVVLIPFSLAAGWTSSRGKPEARTLFLWINGAFVFAAALYAVMVAAMGPEAVKASFELRSPQTVIYLATVAGGGYLTWRLFAVDVPTFRAVAPLVAMASVGPAVFYLSWPYLWHHPVERTAWWMAFHATHNHYAWMYLGELMRGPPFPLEYVVVKTALTVPTSLFVLMVAGFVAVSARLVLRKGSLYDAILVVNAVASIAIISHPTVPHFGGVKHWFPSMVFLSVLAGLALERTVEALRDWLAAQGRSVPVGPLVAAVAGVVALPALIATARVYRYGTSAYSELAGGLPGAASLGMQRQFWANNVTGVLEWINSNARPGERVYLHENHGGQIRDYQRNGMLRTDLRFVGSPFEADLVAYQYHQEFREHEYNTWQAIGTRPVYGLYVDETPQIVVYRR